MALDGRPLECLEDIKGAQSAISTRALMELLHRLNLPQTSSANPTKPKMAAIIAGALSSCEGWATATLSNVHLASSSRDTADLASLAFGLELSIESPLQLFFPAGGIPPLVVDKPEVEVVPQNVHGVGLVPPQPPTAPAKQMTAILALLQEQKMAMSEQKMAMSDQKVALQRLEESQGQNLSNLEASVASHLEMLAGQWNDEFRKVTEQQKTHNKSFSEHCAQVEARLKKLESGSTLLGSAPPTLAGSSGQSDFPLFVDPSGMAPSAEDLQQVQKLLGLSNPTAFNDKLVSRMLSDGNVHLREFLPQRLAPSSDTTFVVEDSHLQLSATVKQFRSSADVLMAIQNVLEVQGSLEQRRFSRTEARCRSCWTEATPWQQWSVYMRNF